MTALMVKAGMADKIVAGTLTSEFRKMKCESKVGQTIYIAKCGTKTHVVPFEEFIKHPNASIDAGLCAEINYSNTKDRYEWVYSNPIKFEKPISYIHPRGAQIWVKLPENVY